MATTKKKVSKTNDAEMQASERNTEFMRLRKEIMQTEAPAEGKVSPRSMHDGDKPGSLPGQEPSVVVFGKDDPKPVLPEPKDPVIERLDRIIALLEGTLTVDKKGLSLSGKFWDRFLDPDR